MRQAGRPIASLEHDFALASRFDPANKLARFLDRPGVCAVDCAGERLWGRGRCNRHGGTLRQRRDFLDWHDLQASWNDKKYQFARQFVYVERRPVPCGWYRTLGVETV